ncbi:MAG: AAA family ATPase [Halofilum sp. (in: g-proteobacteria)]|nr:AAA family ATPase [Halofilum sp. (in: g-proteobacteria)]
MSATPETAIRDLQQRLQQAEAACARIVLGKNERIRLALACLLARGHLLIEDVPGVGKTTLAHTLAHVLRLDYRRIQFTSDLLPADVLGASIYQRETGTFHFHPGPVFAELVLGDEINRAPPKTQSALLEAMEEQQVTVEGETRELPHPFFVIATQNPREQAGTYPLPESQLDRFLMSISLGFPDGAAERELLSGNDRRELLRSLPTVMTPRELEALQGAVGAIHASEPLLDYVQRLLEASRRGDRFVAGLSPRAGLALLAAARAWAMLAGRDYVLPEDIQAVLPSVVDHRLRNVDGGEAERPSARLLSTVAVD